MRDEGPGFWCSRLLRQAQDSLEPGAGSRELGARHIEFETSDGQAAKS